jgi:hypothetical protein
MFFLKKKDKSIIGKLTKSEEVFFEFIRTSEHQIRGIRQNLELITGLFWREIKADRGIKPLQKVEVNRFGQLLLLEEENQEDWEDYKLGLLKEKVDNPEAFALRKQCYEEIASLEDESRIKKAKEFIKEMSNLGRIVYEKFREPDKANKEENNETEEKENV